MPDVTPLEALESLREGNFRFTNGRQLHRNLMEELNVTKDEQLPFATILSCMDSRTSAELIFDQGFGDVFSVRIAGNVITEFVLGSLEYATAAAGSKLILVLGHTGCGAIAGAIKGVRMGHLSAVLERIHPAIEAVREKNPGEGVAFADRVSVQNAIFSAEQILAKSAVIHDICRQGKIMIVPALYNIATGKVEFYEAVVPTEY
jgi:carbonic anhydrase